MTARRKIYVYTDQTSFEYLEDAMRDFRRLSDPSTEGLTLVIPTPGLFKDGSSEDQLIIVQWKELENATVR